MIMLFTVQGAWRGPTGEVALSPALLTADFPGARMAADARHTVLPVKLPAAGQVIIKTADRTWTVPYRLIAAHISGARFHGWLDHIVIAAESAAAVPIGAEIWWDDGAVVLDQPH